MKTEVTEKTVKKTIYICEICGARSVYPDHIKSCEKRHGCKHEPHFLLIDNYDCDGYKGIEARCKKCGVSLHDKGWSDIDFDDHDDQKTLRRVYILLKRMKKMENKEKKQIGNSVHFNYLIKERNI